MAEVIRVADIRQAGYCVSGIKAWFEARSFNWRSVMRDGVPAEDLLATGDPMAERAVRMTRERANG